MNTFQSTRETISNFITVCEKAEDSATGADQVALLLLIDDLRAERMKIDAQGLRESAAAYTGLTQEIRAAKEKLDELSEEIRRIIAAAEIATQLVGTLARILSILRVL